MNNSVSLLIVLSVMFIAAPFQSYAKGDHYAFLEEQDVIQRIMMTLYQNPNRQDAEKLFVFLAHFADSKLAGKKHLFGVFCGELFLRYPDRIETWQQKSSAPVYRTVMRIASNYAAALKTPGVETLLNMPPEKFSPDLLEACWSGFFASGKTGYVEQIIKRALLFPEDGRVDIIRKAALWSLMELSEKHPVIKSTFKNYLRNKALPNVQYKLAMEISESKQQELLGRVLISDKSKDAEFNETNRPKQENDPETELGDDFFDFLKLTTLHTEKQFISKIRTIIAGEVKSRFPELTEKQCLEITDNLLSLKDAGIPRKVPDQGGFLEFLAIQKFMKENNAKERHHLLYLEYALRLASQYHPDADVSRFIFRVLNTTANSLVYLKDEMLQKYKLHPYLVDMLKGGRALRTGWKHRGSGYSDSVTPHGWQSFKENLIQAGKHFSDAYHRHPNYPEAPAQMIAVEGVSSDSKKMAIWLRRSLIAQINYREAIENYVWYKLPRWGGSTADLRNCAKAFFALGKTYPQAAHNGLFLLQAFLSELPAADSIRYFSNTGNYREVKEILLNISEIDASEKHFLGTAAIFGNDMEIAKKMYDSMTPEELNFNLGRTAGKLPSLYWFDFPALYELFNADPDRHKLFKALTRMSNQQRDEILKKRINTCQDPRHKQTLIGLYLTLNARVSFLTFRQKTPVLIRLLNKYQENMPLIKEAIALGIDLETPYGRLGFRPLYYAFTYDTSNKLADLLLSAGADPNGAWGEHFPLDYMIRKKFPPEQIRLLIKSGADPNRKYRKSFTPLHAAFNNFEAAVILVEAGAKLNEVSEFGQTPLDLARKMGSGKVEKYLRSKGSKFAHEL